MFLFKIKTFAFIGPSGTGKSYRAQYVASQRDIKYIIDDGLLIKENEVIAGVSAKKAPTKIETVKNALFTSEDKKEEVQKAIRKYKPESILILGTSDGMVDKIAENLGLPPISERIYINEVATQDEMDTARRMRVTEGKHVIPVPTFEIKKDFSGYLLDPLQIFKSKGKNSEPYIAEKSLIRPTFSYLGNFTISDSVFKDIIVTVAKKIDGVYKVLKIRVDKSNKDTAGVQLYIEVSIEYGANMIDILKVFKKETKREIENLTAMYISSVEIVAKDIHFPE